jgi:hypothetical protein
MGHHVELHNMTSSQQVAIVGPFRVINGAGSKCWGPQQVALWGHETRTFYCGSSRRSGYTYQTASNFGIGSNGYWAWSPVVTG